MSGFLALLLVAIFVVLAVLHFHWALGGRFAFEGVVPSVEGTPLFVPGPGASAAVGCALLAAALVVAWRAGLAPLLGVPVWIPRLGIWVLVIVFTARAIGDFRWVGFFKRHREGLFARRDTRIYSPLCVFLAALAAVVAFGPSCWKAAISSAERLRSLPGAAFRKRAACASVSTSFAKSDGAPVIEANAVVFGSTRSSRPVRASATRAAGGASTRNANTATSSRGLLAGALPRTSCPAFTCVIWAGEKPAEASNASAAGSWACAVAAQRRRQHEVMTRTKRIGSPLNDVAHPATRR